MHGSETTPILALQRLAGTLNPPAVAGTVVLVHVANLPSFLARSVYVSPGDRKNLNRQFPGTADGTVSERIAHVLTREVLTRRTHVVDVHSGDANEDLRPWTGFYAHHGTPEVIAASRAMAVAFGLDRIVEFPFAPAPQEPALYTSAVAVRLGRPAFDVEVGRLGLIDQAQIDLVVRGLTSVMRHLRIVDGAPAPAVSPWFTTRRLTVAAEHDGLFYPSVTAGAVVETGASIGYVTDFHGRTVQEVRAPERSEVLVIVGTPAISARETLVVPAPR